jgi:hypothetical protein
MAKRALPLLTGGLNDVARSDLIDNSQLQECLNYEITGDGILKRRTEQETFDGYLNIKLSELFENVKVISEPYYFVTDIDLTNSENTLNSDYIILAFGFTENETYEMHTLYKVGETWTNAAQYAVGGVETTLNTLLTASGIAYTAESDVQFVVSDDRIIITDNVNNAHFVTIDIDGFFRAGKLGMPAPKNKARVEHITEWDDSLFEETSTDARLSQIGLFQCTYTAVTKSGDESNPSPLSDTLDMQFFKIDANGADERWIDKVSISGLSVPDISENDLEDLKYFKVYMRVIRYSEGDTIQTLDLTEQFEIIDKSSKTGTTGNSYSLTVEVSAGNTVNYENDVAPIAKTAASLGGITMLGNVQTKINFPHEFKYYHPITIDNKDNKHYVDAVVKVRLWNSDTTASGDPFANSGTAIEHFNVDDFFDFSTGHINDSRAKHIRLYDEDATTPIMVSYKHDQHSPQWYVDLYIKIPLLVAGSSHVVYLCWTDEENIDYYGGVPDTYNEIIENDFSWEGNIGVHYGRFHRTGVWSWHRQQVWNNNRVRDTSFIVSPQEFSNDSGALNKANTNINGELTDFYSSTGGLSSIPQLESFADFKMGSSSYATNNNTGNIKYNFLYTDSASQTASALDLSKGFISATITFDISELKDISNGNAAGNAYFFVLVQEADGNPRVTLGLDNIGGNFTWVITNFYYDYTGSQDRTKTFENMPTYNEDGSGTKSYNLFWSWDFHELETTLVLYDTDSQDFSFTGGIDGSEITDLPEGQYHASTYDYREPIMDRIIIGKSEFSNDRAEVPANTYIDNLIIEKGTYLNTTQGILQLWNFQPMYDSMIGEGWLDGTYNNNIDFDDTKEIKYKSNRNMVKWTDVNGKAFPDLYFKKVREPIIKIMPAPSFLQFEYQNTFIIFTRNSINRFVLQGSASGWSGSSSSLIEEKKQYGLLAEKSLVRAGDALFWLSEVGVVKWDRDGLGLITKNIIDVPIKSSLIGYFVPLNNQYILHDTTDPSIGGKGTSYVYHIDRNVWTKFIGLDVQQSITLTGGTELENINLYLKENTTLIDSYPTSTFTTTDSNIKTKSMFFEKGTLKRIKADYTGDSKEFESIIENLVGAEKTHTVSADSNEWRGVPLGSNRGKSVTFQINNADTISSIMYELDIESEVKV